MLSLYIWVRNLVDGVKDVCAKVSCEIDLLEKVVSLQRVRKNKLS